MKYLKRYNESLDSEKYLDYLLSEVEDRFIQLKHSNENLLYLEYNIDEEKSENLKSYILKSERFKDVVVLMGRNEYDNFNILIIDKDFYQRNQNLLFKNIPWEDHYLKKELEKTRNLLKGQDDWLYDRWKDTKFCKLADGFTMTLNLDRPGEIEFWPREYEDDPLRYYIKDEFDITNLQYQLFKYLGK